MAILYQDMIELDDTFKQVRGLEALKLRVKRIAEEQQGDTPYVKTGIPLRHFTNGGSQAVADYLQGRLQAAGITVEVTVSSAGRVSVIMGTIKLYEGAIL
jgi:phospholipid N-methyltransferase